MSLRLGLDIDGVLADFHRAFLAVQHNQDGTQAAVDPEHALTDPRSDRELERVWKIIVRTKNWWTQVPAYEPEQIARLYRLRREHNWEVFFMTRRPPTEGDPVQFQTQWWLESYGFYLPAVITVLGSRGDLANALRLDTIVDDDPLNCADVIGASAAKAILLLRDPGDPAVLDHTKRRGIGVVKTLEEAINVAERLHQALRRDRDPLSWLTDWLPRRALSGEEIPMNPRTSRPIPPVLNDE